ncbi:LRRGT00095 [Rattus norvegicus]|uniref:LRRGT00095 n=2 Tax=Rattus norvegicus TaxID=10116 RepID=F7ES23_RAT|nr:LRRGT00095 [Rattus norvegicus]EDL82289.1 LRRGT00095 [Rattus norvegicus]|eukprot:NP_001041415.1 uncharacterized protein LOC499715 [Rattus norvegicus]
MCGQYLRKKEERVRVPGTGVPDVVTTGTAGTVDAITFNSILPWASQCQAMLIQTVQSSGEGGRLGSHLKEQTMGGSMINARLLLLVFGRLLRAYVLHFAALICENLLTSKKVLQKPVAPIQGSLFDELIMKQFSKSCSLDKTDRQYGTFPMKKPGEIPFLPLASLQYRRPLALWQRTEVFVLLLQQWRLQPSLAQAGNLKYPQCSFVPTSHPDVQEVLFALSSHLLHSGLTVDFSIIVCSLYVLFTRPPGLLVINMCALTVVLVCALTIIILGVLPSLGQTQKPKKVGGRSLSFKSHTQSPRRSDSGPHAESQGQDLGWGHRENAKEQEGKWLE